MSEHNKRLVRRLYEETRNKGNFAVADELAAGDLLIHLPTKEIRGAEGAKQEIVALREAFPDIHFTIDDQIAEGDRVVTRWSAHGTHTGTFLGLPATGKHVRVMGIDIDRFADDKVVECWVNQDDLGLLQKLGVVPGSEVAG